MISKTKLKELAGYKQQKHCSEENVFVVEGVKMCAEVLAAKCPVKYICATNSWLAQHPDLPAEAEVHEVDREALERLSGLKTPNEVWMLLPRQTNSQFSIVNCQLSIALDRLQDPGNLGTIIRTADWFGVRHIVCSPDTVSCYNPKVVQSSMGSLLRTRIDYCPLPEWLAACGMPVYGALLDGDDLWGGTVPLPSTEGAVLVIGNEAAGISPEVQKYITHRVKIPNIGGTAESLNAAVACAILTAEFLRGKVCQSK